MKIKMDAPQHRPALAWCLKAAGQADRMEGRRATARSSLRPDSSPFPSSAVFSPVIPFTPVLRGDGRGQRGRQRKRKYTCWPSATWTVQKVASDTRKVTITMMMMMTTRPWTQQPNQRVGRQQLKEAHYFPSNGFISQLPVSP